jgi:ankyrin repeat protein
LIKHYINNNNPLYLDKLLNEISEYFTLDQSFLFDLVKFAVANQKDWVIKSLVNIGLDLNQYDDNHNTPLILAIQAGDLSLINSLIKYIPDLNLINTDSECALSIAVSKGRSDIVKILLEHGAEPENGYHNGLNPLQIAEKYDQVDIASLLIKAGAEFSQIDQEFLAKVFVILNGENDNEIDIDISSDNSYSDSEMLENFGIIELTETDKELLGDSYSLSTGN